MYPEGHSLGNANGLRGDAVKRSCRQNGQGYADLRKDEGCVAHACGSGAFVVENVASAQCLSPGSSTAYMPIMKGP